MKTSTKDSLVQIPSPFALSGAEWSDVLKQLIKKINRSHLNLRAAGVAFFCMLAVIPFLAALISIAVFVLKPTEIREALYFYFEVLPESAAILLRSQVDQLILISNAEISLSLAFALLLSLWSATRGMKALMEGLNMANLTSERRSFWKIQFVAVSLTAIFSFLFLIATVLLTGLPILLEQLGLENFSGWGFLNFAKWVLVYFIVMSAIAIIYRHGVNRKIPRWSWVTWGANFTTIFWMMSSFFVFGYVSDVTRFNEVYGSLAGVMIFLFWLFLSAYIILLGAEFNILVEEKLRAKGEL